MGKQCCHFFSAIVDQILFIFISRFYLFCAFTRPRYQVSVYRTIGPLVSFAKNKGTDQLDGGAVAWLLTPRTLDPEVGGYIPTRVAALSP